jgi:hypothetical protein
LRPVEEDTVTQNFPAWTATVILKIERLAKDGGRTGQRRRKAMNFARWTTTPNIPGLENAEQFIVEIPEGTSTEEVVAKLWSALSGTIGEKDGLGFQEAWPAAIQREFISLEADSQIRWRWDDL